MQNFPLPAATFDPPVLEPRYVQPLASGELQIADASEATKLPLRKATSVNETVPSIDAVQFVRSDESQTLVPAATTLPLPISRARISTSKSGAMKRRVQVAPSGLV